jgi:hypothetical protein
MGGIDRGRRAALALAALVALCGGCDFSPNLGDGDVRCGAGGICPPGLHCQTDGFCHRHGSDGGAPLHDGGSCTPRHCSIGWCGPVDDGCGHKLDCGPCDPGFVDMAGPVDMAEPVVVDMAGSEDMAMPVDMATPCVPTRACGPGICGNFDDGCNTLLRCGDCPGDNRACSESQPNMCTCVPRTCASVGATCGRFPSGCNGIILDCSTCTSGTCGGGGPYTCGDTMTCNPLTVCPPRACGPIPDGCNGFLRCGGCMLPRICGGGGQPNICG